MLSLAVRQAHVEPFTEPMLQSDYVEMVEQLAASSQLERQAAGKDGKVAVISAGHDQRIPRQQESIGSKCQGLQAPLAG
jgi:hypothetical protein